MTSSAPITRSGLSRLPSLPLPLLALLAGGCVLGDVQMPDAPMEAQMTDIAAIYDNPTGTIDVANIEATLDAAEMRLAQLHIDWLPDLIAEALIRLSQRIADVSLTDEAGADAPNVDSIIDAVVDLHRICRGWSDPPGPPDPANGTVQLTAVIEDGRLRPDVWGTATDCRTRLDPLQTKVVNPAPNLSLDGGLNVRLYGPLPRTVGDAKFLLLFSGRLGGDDRAADVSIDFRVLDGHLAFRLAVSDGDVIVDVGATSIALRGANATFTCDFASRSCQ
jgi:hypothetical protein